MHQQSLQMKRHGRQSAFFDRSMSDRILLPAMILLVVNCSPFVECAYADPSPFDPPSQQAPEKARIKLSTAKEYYMRGTEESQQKNYSDAVSDFDEALRMNPNYGEALGNRGAARFNLNNYQGALSDYDAALKIFPGNQALLNLKAQAEQAISEAANQAARQAAIDRIRSQAMFGGDFADPSTMIMRNAEQGGLAPAGVDMSDPASIIMMNAKRRGLIPQNTPNP